MRWGHRNTVPICFRYRENIIIPTNVLAGQIKTNEEKFIEATLESCFFKSFMACVLGKCDWSNDRFSRVLVI